MYVYIYLSRIDAHFDQPHGSLFSIRWRHKYFLSRAIGYSLRQATACTTFTSASIPIFVALHTLLESSVTIIDNIYDQYSHRGATDRLSSGMSWDILFTDLATLVMSLSVAT